MNVAFLQFKGGGWVGVYSFTLPVPSQYSIYRGNYKVDSIKYVFFYFNDIFK